MLQCDHVIEAVSKRAIMADKIHNVNVSQDRCVSVFGFGFRLKVRVEQFNIYHSTQYDTMISIHFDTFYSTTDIKSGFERAPHISMLKLASSIS